MATIDRRQRHNDAQFKVFAFEMSLHHQKVINGQLNVLSPALMLSSSSSLVCGNVYCFKKEI